ncbi:hypothetical protein AAFF_G00220700 [Aldrovandia affinis]|uniref:Uncharacterized protein n=1 Tax=Aldrovandia affinis TaxID=143900 RepID=A0AAD7W5D7_9TELE|nr:hypothetical protein AAFF_G00220700 [Aldrovandia affinis]
MLHKHTSPSDAGAGDSFFTRSETGGNVTRALVPWTPAHGARSPLFFIVRLSKQPSRSPLLVPATPAASDNRSMRQRWKSALLEMLLPRPESVPLKSFRGREAESYLNVCSAICTVNTVAQPTCIKSVRFDTGIYYRL